MHSSLELIFKEARIRGTYGALCLLVTCSYCYWFSEYLLFILTKPFLTVVKANSNFICTQLTESFNTYITTSFLLSFFFCTPYLLYQIWCFFIPSCSKTQRLQLWRAIILSVSAFLFVFLLVYLWIMPNIWFFLYKVSSFTVSRGLLTIHLQPKIYDFILLTLRFLFIASLCSQVPVFFICCIEYNFIDLQDCIKHRRTFFVFSAIFAALVTPPDIWCQIAAWLPISLLIEITIFLALIRNKYKAYLFS